MEGPAVAGVVFLLLLGAKVLLAVLRYRAPGLFLAVGLTGALALMTIGVWILFNGIDGSERERPYATFVGLAVIGGAGLAARWFWRAVHS